MSRGGCAPAGCAILVHPMSWIVAIAAVVASALAVYLVVAMLAPERFS